MNFWQGKRVRLRGVEPSDAETFFRWNQDSETGRGLEFLWPPISFTKVQKQMESMSLQQFDGMDFIWIIEERSGVAVGAINTHHCNQRDGTFSYGLSIAAEHRRMGYASEAIGLVVKYYFEELRYQKVTATIHDDNSASIRLHEELGFTREGTLRQMFYSGGIYLDQHFYGLTRDDWQNSPNRF